MLEADWADSKDQPLSLGVISSQGPEWVSNTEEEPQNPVTPQKSADSQNLFIPPESNQKRDLSFELSYELTSQSSFDPYGFKLSPEHSSHTLLDPDEVELSPEPTDHDLTLDPEPSSSQPDQVNFDPYGFDITSSKMVRDSDPYGFKLSPEENQEVLDLCYHGNQDAMDRCSFDNKEQVEPSNYRNQNALEPHTPENQEVLEHCSHNNHELLFLCNNGNQEVLESSSFDNSEVKELVSNENQHALDLCSHDTQEVVEPYHFSSDEGLEPYNYGNQDGLHHFSHGNQELLDLSCQENEEVLHLDNHGNQELPAISSKENQEAIILGSHSKQGLLDIRRNENLELQDLDKHEVLDLDVLPEANNNQCILEPELHVSPTSDSSDSNVASEDLLGFSNTSICTTNTINTNNADILNIAYTNIPPNQDLTIFNASTSHNLLEGDLGSVFGAGGYIGCPDVADDLEPLDRTQVNTVAEPVRPVRPVRPPRPSLKVSRETSTHKSTRFLASKPWLWTRVEAGLL